MQKIVPKLNNVPETLLIPLRARSNETKLENGIINDPKSVEIVRQIESNTKEKGEVSIASQKGVAVRTEILDELTQEFLEKNPDGTVVNLGCGLDTRKKFFTPSEKYQLISKSVLDFSWIDVIPKDKPILFIAEGLLMYFTQEEVQSIFANIKKHFPGSEMIFEAMSPFVAKNSNKHADVKKYDAQFKWGIKRGKEVEDWNIGVRFIDEYFYNRHLDKVPLWMRIMFMLPFFKKAMKIVRVKFEK